MSVAPIAPAASAPLDPVAGSGGPVPFSGKALRNASPAEQRAAVAAQFEAILIRQLLGKTMTSMLGSEGGVAGSVYGDMLADTISQQLAAGQGMGFGRYLEKQLTPRGEVVPSPVPSADSPSHP
jgi:Rod binding domain-containing protein